MGTSSPDDSPAELRSRTTLWTKTGLLQSRQAPGHPGPLHALPERWPRSFLSNALPGAAVAPWPLFKQLGLHADCHRQPPLFLQENAQTQLTQEEPLLWEGAARGPKGTADRAAEGHVHALGTGHSLGICAEP